MSRASLSVVSDAVTVRVPAKVNLYLGVGPLRADGYHDLVTVFQALSLCDDVRVSASTELAVTTTGEGAADVPADSTNLAARAVTEVARRTDRPPRVAIGITKRIPVAGGMAGGSADAAGALVGVIDLWGLDMDRDEQAEIAAGLGSDVPFALHGGTALGTGRG